MRSKAPHLPKRSEEGRPQWRQRQKDLKKIEESLKGE